jgi:hypothetical protein
MTEVEQTLVKITGAGLPHPEESPGLRTARRCGELMAVINRAYCAAFDRTPNVTVADRFLRTASQYPAAGFARALQDVATVYPRLESRNRGHHKQAVSDALNGLDFPTSFKPEESAAFLASYLFSVGQHRAKKTTAAV